MMLVPTTREVALSVAVAESEKTAEGLLVVVAIVGVEMIADSLLLGRADAESDGVGASLTVMFAEVGGVKLTVPAELDEIVEGGSSDAGTLRV